MKDQSSSSIQEIPFEGRRESRIEWTPKGTIILTISGYSSTLVDPKGAEHLLGPDADEEQLGRSLHDALSRSRLIPLDEMTRLRELKGLRERRSALSARINARYGFKSDREMEKHARICNVVRMDGFIVLTPSFRESAKHWMELPKEMEVVVSEACTDTELGKAVTEAIARVRGNCPIQRQDDRSHR